MSWRKTIYLMAFVLLLGLAAESVATDYYVATDGDDGNPGTISQPWLSIKQSCYNLQPGDTLHIRGGTYTGTDNINIDFKYNGKHGTQSTPIIIKAYLGEEVIIDAEQAANIFDLQNVDWMTIDSIEFRNGLHDHIFLGYDVAATNITIKNCKFSGIDFWAGNNPGAIYINTTASDITVNNNVMIGDDTDTAGCGVIMFRAAGEIKVFNNEMYGTTNGVFVKHGNDPGCVTRIYNNYIHDVTGNGVFLNTDDGIIENNLIHDAGGAGVRIFEGMGYNGGDNNYISHNTIVNCGGGIYLQHPMDGDPGATNTQIYDNIIYYSSVASDNRTLTIWNYYSGAVEHYTVMNRNCYYDDNYTDELLIKTDTDYYADAYTLAGWQSFSCSSYSLGCQDADSIQQDPLFVSVGADDYHLQSGSPCKGAGSGGSDMGADVDLVGAEPLLDENAYYIDPVSGSDSTGDGSLGNPWKSFMNIQYYYSGPDYPPGWVQLQPGETIYLMDGVHNTLITSGGGYPYMIAFFRFFNGNEENWFHIKAYTGHNPILDAGGTGQGIRISSCSYWEVSGFELKNCAARGIDLEGLNPGKIHDIHIHDVDGDSRNNVCALELNGCSNVEVYDSVFGDVIDTTCEINGTCWRGMMGIAIFAGSSGADISVHDCYFYRTPSVDYTTGGIMYKHGSQIAGSYFDVYNNTFTELRTTSFQTGTANTHFHHNLIVDAATGLVKSQDFGGTTHQTNLTFEYNTFYNSAGFYLSPTTSWVNAEFPDDPTNINFNNNIIYSTDVEKIHLNQYMTDVLYYIMLDEYHSNYNCYYNPDLTPHGFRFASAWNEQPDYSEGGLYSYSEWQTNFGWDLNSTESDPLFVDAPNGDFHLQGGSPATGMGMYPGTGPQLPGQASNPSPANSATDVSVDADLSWNAGSGATSHDVYFGTDSTPDSGELQGNQTATTYEPGTMANSTTYYWRIDEVNAEGTTTGTVWNFTTEAAPQPPGQASNPSPADSATGVSIDADLSWTAGSGATSHDVYFGTSSPGTFQGNQTATTYEPGTMANDTTYHWRIDEINANGTTTGAVWNFTTVAAGAGTGLTGDYYDNMDFTSFVLTRVDPTVNFNWGSGSPDPSIGVDTFSVRWTGQVEPLYSETYTFYTTSDDGVRLWVNSQLVVDSWIDQGPTEHSGTIALTAGVKYDIQMDFYENGGGAVAELRWSSASQAKEIIPQSQLFESTGPQPPGQASSPDPADSASDVSIDADLSWTAGADATSRDVYFGTTSPGAFQGNQTATTFDPGTLSYDVTYYWRIDEVNAAGTTTGSVWSFTTEAAPAPPGQATNPDPADSATDVSIAADLSWTAGTNSTSSDVYFGTSSPGTFQGNQTATTFDPGTMTNDTTYYWRIDEINTGGTTTGNVWSFTTAAAPTYECDNWQSLHPEWIFCDDFESTDPMVGAGRYFEYDDDSGEFVPVAGIGVDNSRGMRVIWQSGETGAGGLKLGFGRNPSGYMDKGIRNTEDFPEVYYRFYLKMQEGWQGNPAKLSRATVIAASDWSQAMIAHHWGSGNYYIAVDPVSCVDASSQVVCIGYNDYANMEWLGGQAGTTPIFDSDNDDIWHYIEHHVKLNDPGQANGITEVWIDGSLDARRDNLDFVTSYTDYAINAIFLENYWDAGSVQLQERYFDSFVVSTQPIGEWTPGPQPPGQASNPSPTDSATDVAVDADLSWTAGTDSTSSDVYFGTSSPGTFQGNQTATTFDPGTMANDTTYYWRIDEVNAEGTTTGTVWSFTTIVTAPGQASSPSPADSAVDIAVDADLSWTAGSGAASHDVYFGTSSPGTFQGNQAATTFDTGAMSNDTTYYWRIDEVNAGGTTTGAVWSFTTIVTGPGQASSPSPGNGATDIAVNADLSWTAGSGAASHDVYFGTSSPGSYQGNQTATTFDTGAMANDTTYYWRIDEINVAGTTTGTVWSFTTIVAAPGPASSPSPGNGATDVAVNADLSWTAGSGAASHDVYFGTSSPGSYQGNQAATTFDTGTMANDTTYYWRIDEVNAGGTTTGAVWSFTTIVAAPGQASSPSPGNSATDVAVSADLSWTAGSGAATHDVYFGTSSPGSYQGNQAATTFDPGTMANDTTYYWRIDEVNAGGTTTGTVWSFTTIVAAPGQASSPSPANVAADVDINANLSWTAGSGAVSHDVYFGTSSPGTFQGNQATTTFDPGTMAYDTTYYWRIDEINVGGTTTGTVWNFTTESAPLPPPGQANNPNPADSATDVGVGADLSWTAGSNATSHDVYFGTSSPGAFQGNQTAVTFDPGTMDNDTTYYWRIDEINASGTTTGVVWSFTTVTAGGQVIEEFGDATNTDHPGTIEDTFADAGTGNDNKSTHITVNTYTWPADTVANTTIIKWDLSAIPTDATVIDATLYLYQVETGGDTSYDLPVHKIINVNPVISACTWNTYDGTNPWTGGADGGQSDIAAAEDTQAVNATNNEYKIWSVTNMVADWVSTPSSNYGMLVNSDSVASVDSHRFFASTEVVDASTRPKLIVTYSAGVAPPGQASSPSPADSATDVGIDADLSWTAGSGADSHDVYFGTSSPGSFQGNQAATTFDTGSMANDTTYYWRIDEVNTAGTTTGTVWSFTTIVAAPGQASNPSPADSATDIDIDADLSWTAGTGATSSDVYFGTTSPGSFQGNQAATTFDPGTMDYDTTYYWRIDEINVGGTTAGVVWNFITEAAPPPLPGQANNPSPADSATDVAVSADLSWTAGSDATSHDVYFGTTSPGTFQGNQTAVTFDPGTMANDTTYYWRIDEVNATGTTTGVVWSFTTIVSAGDEIIGWWELDDASGGTAADSSTYVNDGTLVGPPTWTDDAERGWCLDFADANNYVTIPNESDYDLTGNMTVMAWMKASYVDWRNFSTIIAKGYDGSGGWALQKASRANAMSFYVHVSGMPWDGIKSGVGIFDNQWHHVAGVYDGSNAYIYIDGGLDSNSVACSGNMATNNWDVWIGESSQAKDGGTNAREWEGLIDDVRVYNYALTQGDVNDIYTGGAPTLPGQASNPSPADSATDVSINADLSWTAGTDSTSSDVYFGTSSPGAFQGNQTATTFDPGTMANDTTYYWRIDEINTAGTTTGTVWSFTTIVATPGQASSPSPADSTTDVSVDADLSWTAGSGATSRDIYFGTTSPGAFQGNQTASTFDPSTMSNDTTYYWRIDEINAAGTTTGVVWSFTTVAAPEWTELTYDDFESGWGNYTDGGGDCSLYTYGTYAHQGSNAADIQDNSGVSSSFYYTNGINVDTPGYTQLKVEFWYIPRSMDNSTEDFWLQYYDGTDWHTVETWARGVDFDNGYPYNPTVYINESSYTFPTDMKIRFMCDASNNQDDVYIDEIRVSAK